MNIHRSSENSCFEKLEKSEAVAQRCSVKQAFLEISQNSQENICRRVPFLIKLQSWGLQLYQKLDSDSGVFLQILRNFQKHFFYKRSPADASEKFRNIFSKETRSETHLTALSCCFFRIAKLTSWIISRMEWGQSINKQLKVFKVLKVHGWINHLQKVLLFGL